MEMWFRILCTTLCTSSIVLVIEYIFQVLKEEKHVIKNIEEKFTENKNKSMLFLNNLRPVKKYIYELNEVKENQVLKKYDRFLNSTVLIIFSTVLSITVYLVVLSFTNVQSLALMSSLPLLFSSSFLIKCILGNYKENIIKSMPSYIINLKHYVEIDNNIVLAFNKVTCPTILKPYINKFNISVQKGLSVVIAFENMKKQINIKLISEIITLLQSCYIYGGNYKSFLERYEKNINKIIIEKEKISQELFSSNLVLVFMVCINIYIIISYIFLNSEYKQMMTSNVIGVAILNFNVLSFYLIFYIMFKIKKLEV